MFYILFKWLTCSVGYVPVRCGVSIHRFSDLASDCRIRSSQFCRMEERRKKYEIQINESEKCIFDNYWEKKRSHLEVICRQRVCSQKRRMDSNALATHRFKSLVAMNTLPNRFFLFFFRLIQINGIHTIIRALRRRRRRESSLAQNGMNELQVRSRTHRSAHNNCHSWLVHHVRDPTD